MARPESPELATIDDASAAISIAHERIAIVLKRSAARLTMMDVRELAGLDDDLDRIHHYLLRLREMPSLGYQNGKQ
jgi:hypothetical protein